MIQQHDPDNYGVFNFITTPLDVFTSVISMVSYNARLESIKRAVARIMRQQHEITDNVSLGWLIIVMLIKQS